MVYPVRGTEPWDLVLRAYLDEMEARTGPSAYTGDPVDNPLEWGASLGYDQEWNSGDAVPTGWAWLNQGTALATRAKGRVLITEPALSGSNQIRAIERAIPVEATFEAVAKITGRIYPVTTTHGHFMHLREAVSGKVITFGMNGVGSGNPGFGVWNWTNVSTLGTTAVSTASSVSPLMKFWKVRKNSPTSWDFEASQDGIVWNSVLAAHNVQTFLGAAPTHIGVGLWRNNLLTSMAVDWFRVR